VISGAFTKFFNKKQALILSYAISFLGGLMILFFGESSIFLMPIFVGVARIGISAGFNLIYLMNAEVFPTLFAATAMGICNLLARIVTILSP
jgi:Na+/melibiose symporter-like transporter